MAASDTSMRRKYSHRIAARSIPDCPASCGIWSQNESGQRCGSGIAEISAGRCKIHGYHRRWRTFRCKGRCKSDRIWFEHHFQSRRSRRNNPLCLYSEWKDICHRLCTFWLRPPPNRCCFRSFRWPGLRPRTGLFPECRRWWCRNVPSERDAPDGRKHGNTRSRRAPHSGSRWWYSTGPDPFHRGFPWWFGSAFWKASPSNSSVLVREPLGSLQNWAPHIFHPSH